jgi:hypothetical protein
MSYKMDEEDYTYFFKDDNYHGRENSSHSALSLHQKHSLLLAMGIIGIIGTVTCLIALGVVIVLKLWRFFIHRLAMYQVTAALFFGCVSVFQLSVNYDYQHTSYTLCVVAGFLLEYSLWVKLIFTLCLTFHLFLFSVFHFDLKRLEVAHLIVSIFFPLVFVWVPFIDGHYGRAGAWCWIQNWKNNSVENKTKTGEIEQYGLLYGPSIIALSLCTILVIVTITVLAYRACKSSEFTPLIGDHKKALREVVPLAVYPVLSFILYIPAFINRLIGTFCTEVYFASFMLGAVSIPSLSFFAGLTLILHVLILKCSKPKKKVVVNETFNGNAAADCINDVFTDFDEIPSTLAITQFEPPPESLVDEEYSKLLN